MAHAEACAQRRRAARARAGGAGLGCAVFALEQACSCGSCLFRDTPVTIPQHDGLLSLDPSQGASNDMRGAARGGVGVGGEPGLRLDCGFGVTPAAWIRLQKPPVQTPLGVRTPALNSVWSSDPCLRRLCASRPAAAASPAPWPALSPWPAKPPGSVRCPPAGRGRV